MSKIEEQTEDFVAEGWKRLDPNTLKDNAPKIKWSDNFFKKDDHEKIQYLMKLCNSQNHALDTIQKERNELNVLCFQKEAQINKMKDAVNQNMQMLQSETTKMNEDRQTAIKNFTAKNRHIKELTQENKELRQRIKGAV